VLGPIPKHPDIEDIAFRREPIICLESDIIIGEEWLLDHPIPQGHSSTWLSVLMATAQQVPQAQLAKNRWVAVNARSSHLANHQMQPLWTSLAKRCAEAGRALVIEWTESQPVLLESFHFLDGLRRDYGVQIAIDDVGSAGADGIWRMTQAAPDWIKIDGEFFHRALRDYWARDALAEIVRLARLRGARSIIEWIETPEHLAFAKGLGGEYGQGFLWRGRNGSS